MGKFELPSAGRIDPTIEILYARIRLPKKGRRILALSTFPRRLRRAYGGYSAHRVFFEKNLGCSRLNSKVLLKLFQKLAGWRGGALPRPSQWAKSSRFPEAQEGRENRPVDGFPVGNPSEGFPILPRPVSFAKGNPFPQTIRFPIALLKGYGECHFYA